MFWLDPKMVIKTRINAFAINFICKYALILMFSICMVSIITATFNNASVLAETAKTVLQQTTHQ